MNETEQPALARHTVRETGTQHGQIIQNGPVSVPWEGTGAGEQRGAEARKWGCPQLLLLPALPPLRLDRGAQPSLGAQGFGRVLAL